MNYFEYNFCKVSCKVIATFKMEFLITVRACLVPIFPLSTFTLLWTAISIIISIKACCNAERMFPGKPYSHREILDPYGKFLLQWMTDPKSTDILFNITVETRGYVAIGFSKTGRMTRSDMVLAGVNRGIPYISDRFTRNDKRVPVEDVRQNWQLLAAWENRTHTSVRIKRKKDTCDPQDYIISDNTMYLLWAFGNDDTFNYHSKNRGSVKIHLLQPDFAPQLPLPQNSPQKPSNSNYSIPQPRLDVWRLTIPVSGIHSKGPWCAFQKGPELSQLHNIIGFSTSVTEEKRKRIERVNIYKCLAEYGVRSRRGNTTELMEKFEDFGGACKNASELFTFCKNMIYTWGNGGKDLFLPKNIGVPFGGSEEHYLVEVYLHTPPPRYDNVTTTANSSSTDDGEKGKRKIDEDFQIHTDILLTNDSRKFEAKILRMGYDPLVPLLVPVPISKDFEIFGHCPNECTSKIIPKKKPLRLFGVSFDTGLLGRSATLNHLRNAFELPILLHDGNHDPRFQQTQILPLETPIRHGDQITVRCKYKNTVTSATSSNNTTNSGAGPKHRCLAYLWYYQDKNNLTLSNDTHHFYECMSKIHPVDFARWINESIPREIRRHIRPPNMLDKLRKLKWIPSLQLSLYETYELGRYRSTCGGVIRSQSNEGVVNGTNRIRSKVNRTNNKNNSNNNGTNRTNRTTSSSASTPAAVGEITVYPLPVEDVPNTIGCPTLDGPLLLGPPAPVIFGFP